MRPRLLAVGFALAGVAFTPPSRAAMITRAGSPMVMVSAVTVGENTWAEVWRLAGQGSVRVVPLPDGATDVHLVPISLDADRFSAPRFYSVDRVPTCDSSWSCTTVRAATEAPFPRELKPPPRLDPTSARARDQALDDTSTNCGSWGYRPPPALPSLPTRLRVVGRDEVVATARDLAAPFVARLRATTPSPTDDYDVPADFASHLPAVSRFAVIVGDTESALAFRMRGPFAWPVSALAQGGAAEIVMLVATAARQKGERGTTLFPRALLRAEPPRLYFAPGGADGAVQSRNAGNLAANLAEQLAKEGKSVHLERAMPLHPNERTDPDASLVAALGLRSLSGLDRPKAFRLHRYRFRGVSDIGLSRAASDELPHPRELATAFVAVETHRDEPADNRCPGQFGPCYRPYLENGTWRTAYRASLPAQSGPALVEAPYSLATPSMREPSPFPALAASASASPVPSSSVPPGPAPEPEKAPVLHSPDPIAPGPRGCACDTVPASDSGSAASLATLALVATSGIRWRSSPRSSKRETP